MSIESYLRAAPKAELHVHLEGAIRPATLQLARRNGVALTVNSDDPPLFNTTLTGEALLLAEPFGLDVPAIDEILLNGVRHSFLPPERKRALEAEFRTELAALKAVHLADEGAADGG